MKKAYIQPTTLSMTIEPLQVIAYSGGGKDATDPVISQEDDDSDDDNRSRRRSMWDDL